MFQLMHKNDVVAIVDVSSAELTAQKILNTELLPYGTRRFQDINEISDLLTAWNDARCIPFGRINYRNLKEYYNISNSTEWIALSYMCSLTDCYWFKVVGNDIQWENVNFHQNGFDSDLYKRLFFEDDGYIVNNLNSPDLTTDGVLPKM